MEAMERGEVEPHEDLRLLFAGFLDLALCSWCLLWLPWLPLAVVDTASGAVGLPICSMSFFAAALNVVMSCLSSTFHWTFVDSSLSCWTISAATALKGARNKQIVIMELASLILSGVFSSKFIVCWLAFQNPWLANWQVIPKVHLVIYRLKVLQTSQQNHHLKEISI